MNSGRMFRVLNTSNRVTAAVSMATFGFGLGIGYLLGKRTRPEVERHEIPEKLGPDLSPEDIAKARNETKKKRGTTVIPPMELPSEGTTVRREVEEPIEKVSAKEFVTISPVILRNNEDEKVADEESVKTLFAQATAEWDYQHELARRTSNAPYILHKDEFYADEKSYTQTTLVYYGGDAILVDQDQKPLYNHEDVTGPLKFGHGSGDPNVVYIRNDKNRAEYEVLFDEGLYSVEVLHLDIPDNDRVKHVQHSKVRRFRPDE